jgi:hypothetical protein
LIDWSELLGSDTFDLDAPDLGVVQQPHVATAQVAFSALARPGEAVALRITNPLHEEARLGLSLRLDDLDALDVGGERPTTESLRLRDLRFLGMSSPTLPRMELGADLQFQSAGLEPVFRGVGARALTAQKQRPSSTYTSTHALLELDPSGERDELGELIEAYESARLRSGTLQLECGGFEFVVPTTAFCPTRVSVGTRAPRVVDYSSQIATEAWIPMPRVEILFEGLVVDAEHVGSELHCGALEVTSSTPREVDRYDAGLGRLQLVDRTLRRGHGSLKRGSEQRQLWPAAEAGPALFAKFSSE